jgi:hypothetical protein
MQIPALLAFNAGICCFCTPYFADTGKKGSLAGLNGRGQIQPGVLSRKLGSWLNPSEGFPLAGLESKWKACFTGSTENSEEPTRR